MFMKTILKPLAAAVIAASLSGAAKTQDGKSYCQCVQSAGILRCGAAVAPPYVMRDPATGECSGFFVELCRELATTLDVKPEFVDTTWDNIVAGLQAGKWDVSLALNRTPARAMAVNVSVPAIEYQISLAYNTENPNIPANPVSVADIDVAVVTLAVTSGTAQDRAISAQIKNATVLRLPTNDETRLAVVSPPRIRNPCWLMTFPDPGHLLDAFSGSGEGLDRPLCDHPLEGFDLGQPMAP